MLKTFGILAWGGCLLTLAYQGIHWVIYKNWPSITLMDVLHGLFGFDLLSLLRNLPLDVAAKAIFVTFTTELTLFLWWAGVVLFVLMFILGLIRKK